MRLLLCKSYEMPPSAGASKGPGGYGSEARQKQSASAVSAGLAVGADARYERPGAVARRPARAGLARRARPVRPPHVRASRRLALRTRPGLALRASAGLL